jgi:hypothetical protein
MKHCRSCATPVNHENKLMQSERSRFCEQDKCVQILLVLGAS